MRKRGFDESMLEHVEALVLMAEMDAIIFDLRTEAAGGRRDAFEDTSPRCCIGTSEACNMAHAHAH